MRYTGIGWVAACAAWCVLGLAGCGGEEEPAGATVTAEAPAAEGEQLTAEEAAMLEAFRAGREAGQAGAADETGYNSKAAPAESGHAEVIASIKGEPAGEIPYDFDRAAAGQTKGQPNRVPAVAPAASAPAGNAPAASAPAANAPEAQTPTRPPAEVTPSLNAPTVFRKHEVTDPGLNGIVASSMLYPETWKVEGGITRTPNALWFNPMFLDLEFKAPDGRRLHFFPNMSFEFNAQAMQQGAQLFQPINGNLYYPVPQSPGSWIMELIEKHPDPAVKNVRLISEEPEPQMTKQLQQQAAMMYRSTQEMNQTIAQMGMGRFFDTQATVIKLHYVEDGIEIEESILMAWQYTVQTTQGQVTHANWSISLMVSLGGPVGSDYGNDPELLTILQSIRVNPQWQARMNEYWQEIARIQRRGQEQRNRDWQAHNAKMQKYREDTNAIIADGYATRSAMREVGFEKQIDGVREVTPYNIGGGTVKIPDYYDNVHTDGTGRYILSNDLNYNPNRDLNRPGNWTKVDPAR